VVLLQMLAVSATPLRHLLGLATLGGRVAAGRGQCGRAGGGRGIDQTRPWAIHAAACRPLTAVPARRRLLHGTAPDKESDIATDRLNFGLVPLDGDRLEPM
jgi:hypothetical protein